MPNPWKEWIERAQDLGFTEAPSRSPEQMARASDSRPERTQHRAAQPPLEPKPVGFLSHISGQGDPNSDLVIIVAPDPSDPHGDPLSEPADLLLTAMIEKGLNVARSSIYIIQLTDPHASKLTGSMASTEVVATQELQNHVVKLHPKAILTLGIKALDYVQPGSDNIHQRRGQWFDYQGTPTLPTHHPSYLLRQPEEKRAAWQDLQALILHLGWSR